MLKEYLLKGYYGSWPKGLQFLTSAFFRSKLTEINDSTSIKLAACHLASSILIFMLPDKSFLAHIRKLLHVIHFFLTNYWCVNFLISSQIQTLIVLVKEWIKKQQTVNISKNIFFLYQIHMNLFLLK